MTDMSFFLHGANDCAFAQSAAIALRCRDQHFDWSPAGDRHSALIVQMSNGQHVRTNTIPVLLDWLEELHPEQSLYARDPEVRSYERSLLPRMDRISSLMEMVGSALNNRDLDLALHF